MWGPVCDFINLDPSEENKESDNMTNKIGNGVNWKYIEYIDYKIKFIDKLEDLEGFEWSYKNAEFILESVSEELLSLKQKNVIYSNGIIGVINLKPITLCNLSELGLFGLKVVLNEKPKLTRQEQECISQERYFARDKSGSLYEYLDKPQQSKKYELWQSDYDFVLIDSNLFPFITWESGKAWSKAELMELEVVE